MILLPLPSAVGSKYQLQKSLLILERKYNKEEKTKKDNFMNGLSVENPYVELLGFHIPVSIFLQHILRCLPFDEINKRTEGIIKKGFSEIVLTGVDLTSYGTDLPGKPKLGNILRRLLNFQPNLKRLRLSSIDPAEIDDDLMDLLSMDKRLLPHLHLSLQSGDIITTGTPPGVGMGMKPQQFLKAGDTMKLSIENLGEQNSKVVEI